MNIFDPIFDIAVETFGFFLEKSKLPFIGKLLLSVVSILAAFGLLFLAAWIIQFFN